MPRLVVKTLCHSYESFPNTNLMQQSNGGGVEVDLKRVAFALERLDLEDGKIISTGIDVDL